MTKPIEIDGSIGEGGGQVLRTSLALSMITGKPVHLYNIRAGRKKPGLLRQHLTGVRAATEVSDAEVRGDALRSRELFFTPKAIKAGSYRWSIGTAGSTTLVLQTVLPALLMADGPSEVSISGGTHNKASPPFDFLERSFAPLLHRMGPKLTLKLNRAGFYPAGGGDMYARIEPAKLEPIRLLERKKQKSLKAVARVAGLPKNIAQRELNEIMSLLEMDRRHGELEELPEAWGPGNVVFIEAKFASNTHIVTGFGEKRLSAEKVAQGAALEMKELLEAGVPVCEHLADQLVLLLSLAGGGCFKTLPLSGHTKTQLEIIPKFLDVKFEVTEQESGNVRVEVFSD